jgi:lysophospholipase L1-like esterase
MSAAPFRRRATGIAAVLAAWVCAPAAWAAGHWVEAWYSPPFPTTAVWGCNQVRTFTHQSVRQVVRLETGGSRVRVRLTNELGLARVRFGEVSVAVSSPNGVLLGPVHVLTFGGKRGGVIPIGKAWVSDPVDMRVHRFESLAISVYYPSGATPAGHLKRLWVSPAGNHLTEALWPRGARPQAPELASAVEVYAAQPRPVLVAFGDSITEGFCSTPGMHLDYPEQLARLLAAHAADRRWIVINSGISGNRLLHNGAGPKALARFKRDALDIPGVRAIVLLEGINDIGWAYDPSGDTGPLPASAIIGAYRDLIRQAHARGIKIYLGTLTPYLGALYEHPAGEKVREQVNAWIRRGHGFDGVIHFDGALRDPRHPHHYIGADQCGDDLHPNDAGYHLMAETVYRELFAPGKPLARAATARARG